MLEKRFAAVPPQFLTGDGDANGKLTISNTTLFKVKQEVYIRTASGQPILLEVKEIPNTTTMYLGPIGGKIEGRQDLSIFTVSAGSFIYANMQKRPVVPQEEVFRAVYEEEPTVALRTMLVDKQGNDYRSDNPLPVRLSDGSVNIGTVNAELEVQLSHKDNDPDAGDVHDSVRIGDGNAEVQVTVSADDVKTAMNVNAINDLFSKPFNKLTVLTKNDDGDPLTIRSSYAGIPVQLMTILYDAEGDFQDAEVSDL